MALVLNIRRDQLLLLTDYVFFPTATFDEGQIMETLKSFRSSSGSGIHLPRSKYLRDHLYC